MHTHAVWRAFAASVLLSAGLVAISLTLFDPFFTNDGAVMAMIVSGTGVALQPDEHLVFTNVLLGRPLAALYRRAPDVPWYGYHLVGVQALAWVGLFHACLVRGVTPRRVGLCAIAYGVIGLSVLVNLQFTSTAFLAAAAGASLWLRSADEGTRVDGGLAVGAVALMTLASLERFDPFVLAFAITAVLGAALTRGRPGKRWIAIGAASLALSLAARAYDQHAYRQDAGWQAFREFIPLLPEITDYGRAADASSGLVPALARVGWTENDHRLFMQWFHADPEVYSADALRRLLATAPAVGLRERLGNGAGRLERVARNPALWAMLLALPALVGVQSSRRARGVVVATLLAACVATLLLAAFRKSAPQVYLPLFGLALCIALVMGGASAPPRGSAGGRVSVVLAAIACAGVALSAAVQHAEGRREREQARILWTRFEPITRAPQQLVVAWFNAFPFEVVRPLEPPARLRALRLFSLGWSQRTPLARDLLVSFGSADVIDALTDPRTAFLAPTLAPPLLARYAEEHRALRLRFTLEQAEPFAWYRGRIAARPAEAAPP